MFRINSKEHYILSLLYKNKDKFNLCLDEIEDSIKVFYIYSNPNTLRILLKLNDNKYVSKLNDLWQITNEGIHFIEKNGTCSWDMVKQQWMNLKRNINEIDNDKSVTKNIIFELRNIADIRTFISRYTKDVDIIDFILNLKIVPDILSSINDNDNLSEEIKEKAKYIYTIGKKNIQDVEKLFSEKLYKNLYFISDDDIKQKICIDNINFSGIDELCYFIKAALNSEVIIKIIGRIQSVNNKEDVNKILSAIPPNVNEKIILLALLNSNFSELVKEIIKSKGIEEKSNIEFDYIFDKDSKEINIYNSFYRWDNVSVQLDQINTILKNAKDFSEKKFKNKIQERLYVSLCEGNCHSIKDEYVPIILANKVDNKFVKEIGNFLSILLDDKIEEYNIQQIPNYIEINLTNNLKHKSFVNFAHKVVIDKNKDNSIIIYAPKFLVKQIENFDVQNNPIKENDVIGYVSCKPLFTNNKRVVVVTDLYSNAFENISNLQSQDIDETIKNTTTFIKEKMLPICEKLNKALKLYKSDLNRETFIKQNCGKVEIKFLKSAYDNMILDDSFDSKIEILIDKCKQIDNITESEELRKKLIEIINFLVDNNNKLVVNKEEIKTNYYYDLVFNDEKKKIIDIIHDWDKILLTYLYNYAKNIEADELWFPPDSVGNKNILRKQIYEQNVVRLLTANDPNLYDPIFDNFIIGINLDDNKTYIREKANSGFIDTNELKTVFNDEINQYIDKVSNILLEKIDIDKFIDNINFNDGVISTDQLINYINNSEYSNYIDEINNSINDFKETVIDNFILDMGDDELVTTDEIINLCGNDTNSINKVKECSKRLGNTALYYSKKNQYGVYDLDEIVQNISTLGEESNSVIEKINDVASRLKSSIFDILDLNYEYLNYDEIKERMSFANLDDEFEKFITWYRSNKPLNSELDKLKENIKHNINLNDAVKIAPNYEQKIRRVKDWYSNISKNISFTNRDFEKLVSLEDDESEIVYDKIPVDKIKEYDENHARSCKKRFLNESEFKFVEKNVPSIIPQHEWDKKEVYWLRAQLPNNIKNNWTKFDVKYLLEKFNKINKNNWNLEDIEKIRKYLPPKYKLALYPTKSEEYIDINNNKINYFWKVKFDNIKKEVFAQRS